MKKLNAFIVAMGVSSFAVAQNNSRADETILVPVTTFKSENPVPPSPAYYSKAVFTHADCISPEQVKQIQEECDRNMQMLRQQHPGKYERATGTHPLFRWPVQPAASFSDYGFYTVQFLIDQNLSHPNQLLDYNCGNRTYDFAGGDHQGTDIIYWPYPWRKMEDNVMENVAAAAGVIVSKRNGYFDHQCANNGNGDWNGIILEHADGSRTWYMHFKNNTITSKNIGDAVAEGEYLGLAGSSGSSDWPHLHFQVMDQNGDLIDPWDGTCNSINGGDTWWQSQQTYTVPSINRICTKSSQLDYYSCPNPEITNERDTFNIGDSLWLWMYARDLELNSSMQINIYNPSGQNVINFPFTVPWATYPTNYVRWTYNVVDAWWVQGWWKFEIVYEGNTYYHMFYMTHTALGVNEADAAPGFSIYPNPANFSSAIHIRSADEKINGIKILDALGKTVYQAKYEMPSVNAELSSLKLSAGIYSVQLITAGKTSVQKLVINR